jgi:hypothetical protein
MSTTSSDSRGSIRRAEALCEQVAELLDESLLVCRIDEPVDRAFADFELPEPAEYSHSVFVETIARFVQHVYGRAMPPRRLTPAQSRAEACALISRAYEGTFANGYEGALYDAADRDGPGLELVVARMAEVIKLERHRDYRRWVKGRFVDSADWATKCALVAFLLTRSTAAIPDDLRGSPPERLADDAFELLELCLEADQVFRRAIRVRTADWATR